MADPKLVSLATDFPPGLNTAAPDTDLQPNETPEAYGFDLTVDGKIKTGSVPSVAAGTATARVQKTNTITESALSIPYLWHGRRLWNITNRTVSTASNILTMGALDYDDVFYPPSSRFHKIHFSEDAQTILTLVPIEPDTLVIVKSTGSYVIRNISDTRGFFQFSDIIQEMAAAAATYVMEIGNVVYVGNSNGIVGYENFKTKEVSRKIRPTRATVGALAMTADYKRNWLILGSTYVYDAEADKWFNFSGTSFRFTTRRVRNPDWASFCVHRLIFAVEHGDTTNGTLKYQVRYEDEAWSSNYSVSLRYDPERYTRVPETLETPRNAHKFQVRVTSLPSGKYLREIQMEAEDLAPDDYGA